MPLGPPTGEVSSHPGRPVPITVTARPPVQKARSAIVQPVQSQVSDAGPGGDVPGVRGRDLLASAVLSRRHRLAAATVLLCLHQGGEALVPVLIGRVVDEAVSVAPGSATGTDAAALTGLTGLLGAIAALAAVFVGLAVSHRYGRRRACALAEWGAHDLRMRITGRLLDARAGAGDGQLPGTLTEVATTDAQRAGSVGLVVALGTAQVVGLVVATIAVLRISPLLGALVPTGAALTLLLSHLLGRRTRRTEEAGRQDAVTAAGVAADLVAGLRILNGLGAERAAGQRYREPSRRARASSIQAARTRAVHEGTVLTTTGILLAVVALAAAELAGAGRISVGQLAAAIGLARFLLEPLQALAVLGAEVARARASADRIAQVLTDLDGTWPEQGPAPDGIETAETCELVLSAVAGDGLTGLDLTVAPGELVGLAADEPDEALALLRMLTRQNDPQSGRIRLGGTELDQLPPDTLATRLLVAAHDAVLFGGPLLENVESRTGSAERTERVLAASTADQVIAELPAGRASLLSERGQNLSGGQRQRLTLARALNADSPVLVLHDPTTAVDSVTEARIAAGIRALRRGRATLLVTTSPVLLAVTDRVVLLLGGRAAVVGEHADLARRDTAYRATVLS